MEPAHDLLGTPLFGESLEEATFFKSTPMRARLGVEGPAFGGPLLC